MLVVGAVAAFIVSYFTKFGIYVIGVVTGVQLGYSLTEMLYPGSFVLFIILAIILGLAVLILVYFYMSDMIIEITTFNGFLLFRCAIQYIVFAATIGHFWDPYPIYRSGSYWGIFSGSIFVYFLGIFWQLRKYKNYPYLKNMESSQAPDEKV